MPPKMQLIYKANTTCLPRHDSKHFTKTLRRDISSKMLYMIMIMHFLWLTSTYVPSFQSLLYFPRYGQDKHPLWNKHPLGKMVMER